MHAHTERDRDTEGGGEWGQGRDGCNGKRRISREDASHAHRSHLERPFEEDGEIIPNLAGARRES